MLHSGFLIPFSLLMSNKCWWHLLVWSSVCLWLLNSTQASCSLGCTGRPGGCNKNQSGTQVWTSCRATCSSWTEKKGRRKGNPKEKHDQEGKGIKKQSQWRVKLRRMEKKYKKTQGRVDSLCTNIVDCQITTSFLDNPWSQFCLYVHQMIQCVRKRGAMSPEGGRIEPISGNSAFSESQ